RRREDVQPAPVGRAVALQNAAEEQQVDRHRQGVGGHEADADHPPAAVGQVEAEQVLEQVVLAGHQRREPRRLARIEDLGLGVEAFSGARLREASGAGGWGWPGWYTVSRMALWAAMAANATTVKSR